MSIAEKIFEYPGLYRLKTSILDKLNKYECLDWTPYISNRRVLNVGCGPHNKYFDETLPSRLVGVDPSENFISEIKANAARGEYYVAGAEKLPFEDKSFDTVVFAFVIHHLPFDHEIALREAARVASHNILIIDHCRSNNPIKSFVQGTYWNSFDGGTKYNTRPEWNALLARYKIRSELFNGQMFGNIAHFILDLQ